MELKNKQAFRHGIGRLPGTRRISFSKVVKQIGYKNWNDYTQQENWMKKRNINIITKINYYTWIIMDLLKLEMIQIRDMIKQKIRDLSMIKILMRVNQ